MVVGIVTIILVVTPRTGFTICPSLVVDAPEAFLSLSL